MSLKAVGVGVQISITYRMKTNIHNPRQMHRIVSYKAGLNHSNLQCVLPGYHHFHVAELGGTMKHKSMWMSKMYYCSFYN